MGSASRHNFSSPLSAADAQSPKSQFQIPAQKLVVNHRADPEGPDVREHVGIPVNPEMPAGPHRIRRSMLKVPRIRLKIFRHAAMLLLIALPAVLGIEICGLPEYF